MLKPLFLLLVLGSSLGAQRPAASPVASPIADSRMLWTDVSDYITRAAAAAPDSVYAYRPTPAVRTFGQIVGHVAGAQRMFCAAALGEKAANEDDIEKSSTTRATLIEALRQSNAYCARAYSMSNATAAGTVDLFGARRSRLFVLLMNATHDNEHYGNIVTYMRLQGMVPPSSQR
jgi:uncharacterized damage-inducible protein DinB